MNITVWMFDPNIELISTDLQNLYTDLKDYAAFSNQTEWINYYINFQAKSEYIIGHVPNTQNSTLEFKEIFSNFESI